MRIGITGHQERPGISWDWVSETLTSEILKLGNASKAYSSLAAGADQAFATVALQLRVPLVAVIPISGYTRFFQGEILRRYHELIEQSEVVQLPDAQDDQEAFYKAGQYVSDQSNVLFALWDGKHAQGFGGTADIVDYARSSRRTVVHLNPIDRSIIYHHAGE